MAIPPPEPSRDSGTPLLKESENNEAVDQQVLISAEPNIFQDKVKMKERRRVSQTILVPNLSDTMRQRRDTQLKLETEVDKRLQQA